MDNKADQGTEPKQNLQEGGSAEMRQAIALEKIAEELGGLRIEIKSVRDALSRIANRTGRRDE